MKLEILTLGNELLDGRRIDTNTAWLGRKLSALGLPPNLRQSTCDIKEDIIAAFELALRRSDIIVSSGGLGPTQDDLTFEALSEALGVPLRFHEDVWQEIQAKFAAKGLRCTESNRRQAYLPQGAIPLPNRLGTAPGLYVSHQGRHIFCLPGVPSELMAIFEDEVQPRVTRLLDPHHRVVEWAYTFVGLPESHLEEHIEASGIRNYAGAQVNIAYTASFPTIDVTLSARLDSGRLAEQVKQDLEAAFMPRLKTYLLCQGGVSIEEKIMEILKARGWRLGIAESMTGGLLSGCLIGVPGASEVIDISLVTYSNDMKQRLLGVSDQTLRDFGAVSPQCATEMAMGMCTKFGCDVGVSVTGIAGPSGGSATKPVGLTYIAVCGPQLEYAQVEKHDASVVNEFRFRWDRDKNRSIAVYEALKMLRNRLQSGSTELK